MYLPRRNNKPCTAVRETDVTEYHDGPIEVPLKPLKHQSTIASRCLRGALNLTRSCIAYR